MIFFAWIFNKLAGHIPGAVNRFHQENLAEDKFFLSDETLKKTVFRIIQRRIEKKRKIPFVLTRE